MQTTSSPGRRLLYLLIFLSGCAGLIYQVVWHRYLSILLGAQARATAIVLAIFLGGISAGYTFFGRWSRHRRWNLLMVYAAVELGLGIWAYCFPYFFRLGMPIASRLYSFLGVGNLFTDLALSVLLLGLPTFLMGGTLPLLTQALSGGLDDASRTHAKIYGFNTVGACVGSLLAGYVLIPATSLPIAVTLGGSLNILVALFIYFGYAKHWRPSWETQDSASEPHPGLSPRGASLLGIGLLSGFYILTLETVLIRLMGLSTGASNYNFTLIVSLFVFGLGFGSLVVTRISRFDERHLMWNQLGVAFTLFLLYLSGDCWPYGVHLVRIMFRDIPQSFYFFQTALGLAFLLLLVVPVGMCGLTLPLCFHLLKDKHESLGHRVGQLYGLNTVGCVTGALVGGYTLLAFLNLDQIFKICVGLALVSFVLAAYLAASRMKPTVTQVSLGSSLFTLVLVGLLIAPLWKKKRFIQPFRQQAPIAASFEGVDAFTRALAPSTRYLDYKDGRNTSVGVGVAEHHGEEMSRTIFVNGKSDGNTRGDFFTMNLTGHIPALLARNLDRVAVIGFGTGLTTGALNRYQQTRSIDVVEISDTIIKDAYLFDSYNGGVSRSPKVHFNEMDALRFLEGTRENFDVIVAEPSNPWVAGVENLYSAEFYAIAKRKLKPHGMYFQWLQAYSFTDDLFRMVLRTITDRFPHVCVFQMLEHDFLLVASDGPITREDLIRSRDRMRANPDAKRSLETSGINRIETLLALEVIPSPLTPRLGVGAEEQHLEIPRLSDGAAKAFYVGSTAQIHAMRRELKEYYPAIDKSLLKIFLGQSPSRALVADLRASFCDNQFAKGKVLCGESIIMSKFLDPASTVELTYQGLLSRSDLRSLASFQPSLPAKNFSEADLQQVQEMFDLFKSYYSPIAQIPSGPILSRLEGCLRGVGRDEDLYGDCLLEKAAVLEIVKPSDPDFLATMNAYFDWFATLSPNVDSYARFKDANSVLESVVKEMNRAG